MENPSIDGWFKGSNHFRKPPISIRTMNIWPDNEQTPKFCPYLICKMQYPWFVFCPATQFSWASLSILICSNFDAMISIKWTFHVSLWLKNNLLHCYSNAVWRAVCGTAMAYFPCLAVRSHDGRPSGHSIAWGPSYRWHNPSGYGPPSQPHPAIHETVGSR